MPIKKSIKILIKKPMKLINLGSYKTIHTVMQFIKLGSYKTTHAVMQLMQPHHYITHLIRLDEGH